MGKIDDLCEGIDGAGYVFFLSRVASIIEETMNSSRNTVDVGRLLKAFHDAKEYTKKI